LLSLMADDVVFLVAGQAPMRGRDTFAAGFQELLKHHRIHSTGEIKEIQISGDMAYCWAHLSVTVTPIQAGSPKRRSGYVLTILRKQPDGAWVIVRDANLLTVESSAST
ncbi:MAG: YybH family protein, partial [bacterium]